MTRRRAQAWTAAAGGAVLYVVTIALRSQYGEESVPLWLLLLGWLSIALILGGLGVVLIEWRNRRFERRRL